MTPLRRLLLVSGLTFTVLPLVATKENWPQFRGPTMNAAVGDNANLPARLSQIENIEWVTANRRVGWSSLIVWDQRDFRTTVVADGKFDEPKS